ncbi:MAG: hypothetical protein AUJ23_02305 [Candidatus Magasanikbacteria bacterium CG1_02_32_51]|uniref:Uncharacterized protein n=1 Tax=Candidatus Magasanikbacteria bacterium CG1_02_32_51 TaxID=1805238 RepID=A0A1J4U7L9_9BACT|nr:MAG: hypothetical protein AUJ23_02305 [Candidatus Magasanikbacteria bacterium CG1_02_32_51]
MSQNLSINLSSSSLLKPKISTHAQDFSTSILKQKKDIFGAKTSMEKAMKGTNDFGPTSSISRIGQSYNSASTSVSENNSRVSADEDDTVRDEIRDRLRSKHIRQMMKDKKNNPNKDKK